MPRRPASTLLLIAITTAAVAAEPPIDLGGQNASTPGAPNYASAAVTLPDGTLESYYRRGVAGSIPIFRMRSTDSGWKWIASVVFRSVKERALSRSERRR